jgi:hypothetical protein
MLKQVITADKPQPDLISPVILSAEELLNLLLLKMIPNIKSPNL